jgi:hypothetical protein
MRHLLSGTGFPPDGTKPFLSGLAIDLLRHAGIAVEALRSAHRGFRILHKAFRRIAAQRLFWRPSCFALVRRFPGSRSGRTAWFRRLLPRGIRIGWYRVAIPGFVKVSDHGAGRQNVLPARRRHRRCCRAGRMKKSRICKRRAGAGWSRICKEWFGCCGNGEPRKRWGRVGSEFARSLERNIRRGNGLADWGLGGCSPARKGGFGRVKFFV